MPTPIPEQFTAIDSSADAFTIAGARNDALAAQMVAEVYGALNPGEPWPTNVQGQPVGPWVLMAQLSVDDRVPSDIQDMLQQRIMQHEQTAQTIIDSI